MISIGEHDEQIDVKPTMSENNMVMSYKINCEKESVKSQYTQQNSHRCRCMILMFKAMQELRFWRTLSQAFLSVVLLVVKM